jgi:hypothetical protein
VNLNNNPIFLTQKRLVHRGGVLAAILIAALVGFSLVSGMIAYRAAPENFSRDLRTPQEAGKMFYGWTIAVEIVVLLLLGFNRISRTLGDERKAGLWDSNRLTPLKPSQLITGYWLGSALREFYMALVLAGTGLIIVLLAALPITMWLETQVLIFSTAFFTGLLAVVTGMVFKRPQSGVIFMVLIYFLQSFSFTAPRFFLSEFLLPVYGIFHVFTGAGNTPAGDVYSSLYGWSASPQLFGLQVNALLLSLGLQLIIGIFLWRLALRKTANPFQPVVLRGEAAAVFGILLLAQHGLMWGLWRGNFPTESIPDKYHSINNLCLLSVVQGCAFVAGITILALSSPQPETIRLKALRQDNKSSQLVFPESAVSLALILSTIATVVLFVQFVRSFVNSWQMYLAGAGNLFAFFLTFSLLFEYCRLRYKQRALGFMALWLFILWILPFIFAGVFSNAAIGKISLLAPGICALANPDDGSLYFLLGIDGGHLVIALLLFIGWRRAWRELLAKASPAQN